MPSVLLTRPRERSSDDDSVHRILTEAGIAVEEIPMISFSLPPDVTEFDFALQRAAQGDFDAAFLFSPTAVHFFDRRAKFLNLFDAIRNVTRFIAIGEGTASALHQIGINADIVMGVIERNTHRRWEQFRGKNTLLLQSQIGLRTTEIALSNVGANVERVTLYHTNGPSNEDAIRLAERMSGDAVPDVVAFFSPSAVRNFFAIIPNPISALAAIGPTTAAEISATFGNVPDIISPEPDLSVFAHSIVKFFFNKC